jgi:ketosteroid isomerase-like protein
MDNIALAKSIFEAEDFQPLLDRLADDVVFKATIPRGTSIGGEFRGKRVVIDYFANLGEVATYRQEKPLEFFGGSEASSCWATTASRSRKSGTTARHENAIVADFRDGLITSILMIQDLLAIAEAYRTDSRADYGAVGRQV